MKTFRPNAGKNGNALEKFAGNTVPVSPLALDYKGNMVIGDAARIRIFTLDEDDIQYIPCKKGDVIFTAKETGKQTTITKTVHNIGAELADLTDSTGSPFAEWKDTALYRIPVWVYGIYRKDNTFEELNAVRFIEIGPGLKKSLEELRNSAQGLFSFDEETQCPEYDILLKIIKGDMVAKNYVFEGINMNPKTKKTDAHFNVPAEKVLEDSIDQIVEELPVVKEAMSERMSAEFIRSQFRKWEDNKPANPITQRFSKTEETQEQEDSGGIDFGDDTPISTPVSTAGTRKKYKFMD
jgi:hypothetical protein